MQDMKNTHKMLVGIPEDHLGYIGVGKGKY
jgi:hypothetical protein